MIKRFIRNINMYKHIKNYKLLRLEQLKKLSNIVNKDKKEKKLNEIIRKIIVLEGKPYIKSICDTVNSYDYNIECDTINKKKLNYVA